MRRRILALSALEDRVSPATLRYSLYPKGGGPQPGARFGAAVALSESYRVVGAPFADTHGLSDVGQVFVYDAKTGNQIAVLSNPLPDAGDLFGVSVAVSGGLVVVGADQDDAGATNAGSVFVFNLKSASPSVPVAVFHNPSPFIDDAFGNSVGISGSVVVVGAASDDTGFQDSGSAYVYDLDSGTPTTPLATLKNPGPGYGEDFGRSVAISNGTVVVGAPRDATGGRAHVYDAFSADPTTPFLTLSSTGPPSIGYFGNSAAIADSIVVIGGSPTSLSGSAIGAAYVFDLDATTPDAPIASLFEPTPFVENYFGYCVGVSGRTVVVGAYGADVVGSNSGAVYVFDLDAADPDVPALAIANPTPKSNDRFGCAVAVSHGQVLTGAYWDDTDAAYAGSAYVFDLASLTPTTPVATIGNQVLACGSEFGFSVAASATRVVAGAPGSLSGGASGGVAYVHELASSNPKASSVTLPNPSPNELDDFGCAVATSGNTVVVGARMDETSLLRAGVAFVFDLSSPTPTAPVYRLPNPSPGTNDFFGNAVAVSGRFVVVSAPSAYHAGNEDTGVVYVYDLDSPSPSVPALVLHNPSPNYGDNFGTSISLSGNLLAVGAKWDDTKGSSAGAAYVFDLGTPTPTVPIATLFNPIASGSGLFGNTVSVSGNYIMVGAPGQDTIAKDSGAAYVYDLNSKTPFVPFVSLFNPAPAAHDFFGIAVAIDGATAVVGAYADDAGAAESGSTYVYNLSSPNPAAPIASIQNPMPAVGDYFGSAVAVSGGTVVIGAWPDDNANFDQGAAHVFSLPSRIAEVRVNGGTGQRSLTTNLAVTFDQAVTFKGEVNAAFQLRRQSDNQLVGLSATVTGTTVALTFTGGPVEFGSLADGRYTLTIDATQVSNSNGQLDGDGNGTPGGNYVLVGSPANGLFRLFGDGDGDGDVDAGDFGAFRLAFGGASGVFDFDGDGDADAADFAAFRGRFGMSV